LSFTYIESARDQQVRSHFVRLQTTMPRRPLSTAVASRRTCGYPRLPELRVVHELPNRVRLRLVSHPSNASLEFLAAALRRSALVVSFRLARDCNSVTVEHVGSTRAVMQLVTEGLARRNLPHRDGTIRAAAPSVRERQHRQVQERRLVWCSAVGLALTILPTPAKPGLLALRFALSIAVAIVQHRAECFTSAPRTARVLDLMAWVVSLLRAEHWLRELLGSLLHQRLQDALRPRVQCGFGAAPLPLCAG
jgi:hypothetical protein